MTDFRSFAHLSPPLRSEDDRQAALAAIADGTIDVLASGHDPRGPEEKRLPFADAAPGAADAEHLLALALRSEEHTSELQSLMRTSYAVFCLHKKTRYNVLTPNTKPTQERT